jgi:proline iminopeptidase
MNGIPGVLVHGRYDVSSPLETGWRLSQGWTTGQLHVVADAGHGVGGSITSVIVEGLAWFAAT